MGNVVLSPGLGNRTDGQIVSEPSFLESGTVDVGGQHGYDPRTVWRLPATLTDDGCQRAQVWLAENAAAMAPPSRQSVERWLIMLGASTAGKADEATVEAKLKVYATMFADRPNYWFTADSLKAAARTFKWFPSVAELTAFLEKTHEQTGAQIYLARRMADRAALVEIKRRAG